MTSNPIPLTDVLDAAMPGEYPARGRMMVVADDWQAVYWLPGRVACLTDPGGAGVVRMRGDVTMIAEAEVQSEAGAVGFDRIRRYHALELAKHPRVLRAYVTLADPAAIDRVLIANTTRSARDQPLLDRLHPVAAAGGAGCGGAAGVLPGLAGAAADGDPGAGRRLR